jgi:hypothetical protein
MIHRIVLLSLLILTLASGCRASDCEQMMQCCRSVKGLDGLGSACGSLAEGASDPNTCRSVTMTVRLMLERKQQPVPAVCQP